MADNVIEFGELRIRRQRESRYSAPGCQHLNMVFDDNGGTVECEDCKKHLDLYWVLGKMSRAHADAWAKVESAQADVTAKMAASVELRAAQRVEQAWRSRKMVPACPHCHEPVFPTDGFGGTLVNKEMAIRRRETKLTAKE